MTDENYLKEEDVPILEVLANYDITSLNSTLNRYWKSRSLLNIKGKVVRDLEWIVKRSFMKGFLL